MLRREAIGCLWAGLGNGAQLQVFQKRQSGSAILLDVGEGRRLAAYGPAGAEFLAPPGSVLKPLVISALILNGKLAAGDSFLCPGKLAIAGRNFTCSHPPVASPIDIQAALAYSCNCFVAHFAQRLARGELAAALESMGLTSGGGGRIRPAEDADAIQLQSLGEWGVLLNPAGVAAGFRALALFCHRREMLPVLEGLEGAVEFGTARRAQVPGLQVAGKTGSARGENGSSMAWFAGFAPSRAPQVVVAVRLQGRSGGADAAPVAARLLEAHRAGRLS
jgi:membrane peptidoglycan carboxypeptidase